jgi:adenine specific DNA methylase Mod
MSSLSKAHSLSATISPDDHRNELYYGDNLSILRDHILSESIDLIYLDPPFNSNQDYNVLFTEQDGTRAAAQMLAFEDTWQWDQAAAQAYQETVEAGGKVSQVLRGLWAFLGGNNMMAYLAMMAPRLVELHRVLRPTGSIYLHCDPTASHYIKLLMDAVFGPENFKNEIIWKRHNARSTDQRWPRVHDVILFYAKSKDFFFRSIQASADKTKLPHTLITGADGQKYQTFELTAPASPRPVRAAGRGAVSTRRQWAVTGPTGTLRWTSGMRPG